MQWGTSLFLASLGVSMLGCNMDYFITKKEKVTIKVAKETKKWIECAEQFHEAPKRAE
jgi:hypothetical protein